ncbi:MAG: deoxyguanosinetriphosphate triphosphohydrolase [candidate division Zixibacteria bacterium]|nr:deoxyguanosinetriphosphate triphosphohydrolase [candidate division Zixibacteria bacterium]
MIDRHEIERREREFLAGYAARAAESRGRVYPQDEHPLRTAFQRDRDRIIHSAAFRRMEYKTQVFLPHEGDHYRTRLTHTIEVAQVARTLSRCLGLNEDLTEAVALAHDLGHTPFGHAGEDVLDELLADCGGFNHNRQSLRVIDWLEQRYPGFAGLNLSYEVREGIAKHETKAVIATAEFHPDEHPTLEATLVDLADEIAYNAADVDDGINAGLISFDDVVSLSILADWDPRRELAAMTLDQRRYAVARILVNRMATDVLDETQRRIAAHRIKTLSDVRRASGKIAGFSAEVDEQVRQLKAFLMQRVYRHPRLMVMTANAREIIQTLFARFLEDPSLMPARFQEMLEQHPLQTVIADYVAGMTDRFAQRLVSQRPERCD